MSEPLHRHPPRPLPAWPGDAAESLQLLWDRLAGFGAARSIEALLYGMDALAELLNAQHAYWIGSLRLPGLGERDPLDGWRVRAFRFAEPTPARQAISQEHLRRMDAGEIDQSITENLRGAGRYRINILSEMMPPEWFASDFFARFYTAMGTRDAIFAVTPVGPDIESWLCFERIGAGAGCFGEAERARLDAAVRPLKWYHRQLVLHHGVLLEQEPLTESERRVLAELLTEQTEAEIAAALSLSPTTVHTYCTRIFRKFGVRGRPGLTALWLGRVREIDGGDVRER